MHTGLWSLDQESRLEHTRGRRGPLQRWRRIGCRRNTGPARFGGCRQQVAQPPPVVGVGGGIFSSESVERFEIGLKACLGVLFKVLFGLKITFF